MGNTIYTMEDNTKSWSRMSLFEQEGGGFSLCKELGSTEFIIAPKFFTSRILNVEAEDRTLNQIWRSQNGFKIKDLGNNTICFFYFR